MNFLAYVERQKRLIRERHEGEEYLFQDGEAIPLDETHKILCELYKMKGLNTKERMKCSA